jgi:nitrogen fixation/metabolism regulation signal transduction histidine kinase
MNRTASSRAIVFHPSMPTRVNNSKADHAVPGSEMGTLGTLTDSLWISILDAIPEGISVHSASGEILWANGKLCQIYCKPLSELKGSSCCQVFQDGRACPHEQVLAAGTAVQVVGEVRVSGRNLSVTFELIFDERNNTCGFIRVMRDVTGERHAQEQLLKAERFATLGQLLSAVAHDVGTPLNVISGYAEFLLMRTKPEGQGHKELSAILDQTRRIAAMFGQALDLARSAQGRTDAIEIKALLADSLDLIGHHLRKADVKAGLTCRIIPPLVYGEAQQLRQAFFNLLLNAGQQVGTGGRLQVVIDEAAGMPGFLGLALFGTGASGAGHDFSQSFAGFFAAQSETETAGIGLYLSRRILDDAGAKITFTEAGEQGVGLMIYLPVNAGSRA